LRDARVELADLWDVAELEDALQREPPARVLQRMVQLRHPTDATIEALVARLRVDPALRVAQLARELGVSERQLNRRCTAAVGYGPKLLARILRMQNITLALRQQGAQDGLAALALRFGFADQAHFTHESSELYGATPGQLRAS
ncbi:MAG TPA: helix-turn-helix transcriptional regulator, partial [Polyangiales bacterium]|nr:helix-turn-helix transcriptional regulator [Polyangiales bacterium]